MVRAPKFTDRRNGSWRPALALVLAWMVSGGAGLALADGGGHHHEGGYVQPAVTGQSHDAPAPDRAITGSGCPAGHNCADHSH
jgi:hypothetical protein